MSELKIGVIGYGGRVSGMARALADVGVPYRVTAVADPRAEEIRNKEGDFLRGASFHADAGEMLAAGRLDGVMIGTRCHLHSEMALKVAPLNLPLFLEKPVAITFEQVRALEEGFRNATAPVVVSFPLRVSPLVARVKEIIDSGALGTIEHVVAFNDVPYGEVYFGGWYRDYAEVGGLFLQKATHDLDYVNYLLGQSPKRVCAMKSQRVWGRKDKPFDLKCRDCGEKETCPESSYNARDSMLDEKERKSWGSRRMCLFSKDIRNEDSGNCLVEYENGVQVSYTQNFFARHKTARRGARLYGYRGTVEFDWYRNRIEVYRHDRSAQETIDFSGAHEHFGGDRELCADFIAAVRDRRPSRAPLAAGIESALLCLCARESADTGRFVNVRLPR